MDMESDGTCQDSETGEITWKLNVDGAVISHASWGQYQSDQFTVGALRCRCAENATSTAHQSSRSVSHSLYHLTTEAAFRAHMVPCSTRQREVSIFVGAERLDEGAGNHAMTVKYSLTVLNQRDPDLSIYMDDTATIGPPPGVSSCNPPEPILPARISTNILDFPMSPPRHTLCNPPATEHAMPRQISPPIRLPGRLQLGDFLGS